MYTLYILYNVHTVQTNWWKPVQLYCVHTVQLNCSPMWKQSLLQGWAWATVGPQRGQLTASPATRWERPLSRVLLPFPCYQGFPALEGLGKQPLPGVGSVAWVESQARLPTVPCTSLAILIGWPMRGHQLRCKPNLNTRPAEPNSWGHWSKNFYKGRGGQCTGGQLLLGCHSNNMSPLSWLFASLVGYSGHW